MGSYALIKYVHMGCALVSLVGFVVRGYWMLSASTALQHPLTRRLPHVVDTLLLCSAIALVVMSRQYPWVTGWVGLKIGLLPVYIGFGAFALKRGRTLRVRTRCLLCAIITIGLIFRVALTKPVLIF